MRFKKFNQSLRNLLLFITLILISGCSDIALMNPKGQVGLEQRSLILTAISFMLIVVIPVIIMAFIFTIKYRALNTKAVYTPNWVYSNRIEILVWLIPIIIILFLSVLTWKSTYDLDPSKPIISNEKSINIQVISMDWKWLFIYPELGIATVNEVVFPSRTPVKFSITSNSVMNSFFIPQLGGQIYAMPGMNATLYLIANESGCYKGISSNFSGRGFSGMKFVVIATKNITEFDKWVKKVKISSDTLSTINDYNKLAAPSECHPIKYFSYVKPTLYQDVIRKFTNREKSICYYIRTENKYVCK